MAAEKFIHFKSRNTRKLDLVAKKLSESHSVEVVNLGFFQLLKYFLRTPQSLFDAPKKEAFEYFKNNHFKSAYRSPRWFSLKVVSFFHRLSYHIKTRIAHHLINSYFKKNEEKFDTVLIWGGSYLPQTLIKEVSKDYDKKTLFFEVSSLPNKIQVDPEGVNFQSSLARDPNFFKSLSFPQDELLPAQILIRQSKVKHLKKLSCLPQNYLFVPFQVPSDSQILDFSPWIKDMVHFYNVLYETAEIMPHLQFVVKEHPSYRISVQDKVRAHSNIHFANSFDTEELIKKCDSIITINSSVGLTGLISSKKVIVLGETNYDVEGLVQRAHSQIELVKILSSLQDWKFDENLRQFYLKYFYNRYLVTADYHNMDEKAISGILEKLKDSDTSMMGVKNENSTSSLLSFKESSSNRA